MESRMSRAAARIDARDTLFHLLDVVGELDVQVGLVVEIHHEHLVLRVGSAHQIERRLFHAAPLLAHTAAVVDHHAQRYRNVFPPEYFDALLGPVLVDLEGALREIGQQLAFLVHDAGVQDNQPRFAGEFRSLIWC